MDFEIDKKKTLVKLILSKSESNDLSQEFILDMQQEVNRCNHILKHILRSQYNFEGRLCCGGVFGTLAFLLSNDQIKSGVRYNLKTTGLVLGSTLFGGLFGYFVFGARKFGSDTDYRKNLKMYENSLSLDEEIKPIFNSFNKKI